MYIQGLSAALAVNSHATSEQATPESSPAVAPATDAPSEGSGSNPFAVLGHPPIAYSTHFSPNPPPIVVDSLQPMPPPIAVDSLAPGPPPIAVDSLSPTPPLIAVDSLSPDGPPIVPNSAAAPVLDVRQGIIIVGGHPAGTLTHESTHPADADSR